MAKQDMPRESLLDRFCRYVKIDTQSADGKEEYPSTEKQKDLSRVLVEDLKAAGLADAEMDKYGYVYATLPSNIPENHPSHGHIPAIGFLAHVDTYHEVSGKDVKPQIHRNYNGKDIVLQGDLSIVLKAEDEPELARCKGMTIVTADGTTLLGADDKAGVAEILEALWRLKENPQRLHGAIRIAFTVDEEVGRGTDFFDVKKFGAAAAYTIDGSGPGEIEDETFCADSAFVTITGQDIHPGYAKGKMLNALRLASDLIMSLPQHRTPETTEKREGYLHPISFSGNVSEAKLHFLVRDFTEEGLKELEEVLKYAAHHLEKKYAGARLNIEIKEAYRNMKYALVNHPKVVEYAEEAMRRVGLIPQKAYIRGGTDGSRLSFLGLPTPNLFDGAMNYHGKKEWIALESMEKAVDNILSVIDVWVEKGGEKC